MSIEHAAIAKLQEAADEAVQAAAGHAESVGQLRRAGKQLRDSCHQVLEMLPDSHLRRLVERALAPAMDGMGLALGE